MFNIVFLVVTFGFSIFIASLTIKRQKGEDWYSPISNNEKMVESIINISIVLVILTTISKYLLSNLMYFFLLFGLIIIITSIVLLFNHLNNFEKRNGKKNNEKKDNSKKKSNEQKKTLRDLFTRFITVYNVLYFIFSITHIWIISEHSSEKFDFFDNLNKVLEFVFETNNTLVFSFTILIWTSLIGAIMSLIGWAFSNKVDELDKKEKVNYSFFVDRVMSRNKKSK